MAVPKPKEELAAARAAHVESTQAVDAAFANLDQSIDELREKVKRRTSRRDLRAVRPTGDGGVKA